MAQLPFRSQTSEGFRDEANLAEDRPDVKAPQLPAMPEPELPLPSAPEPEPEPEPVAAIEPVSDPITPVSPTPNYRTRPLNLDTQSGTLPGVVNANVQLPEIDVMRQGIPEVGLTEDAWLELDSIRTQEVSNPSYYLPSVDPDRNDYDYIDEQWQAVRQQRLNQLSPGGVTHPLDTPTRGAAVTAPLRNVTTGAARGIFGSTVPGQVIQQLQRIEEENGQISWLGRVARGLEEDLTALVGGAWQGLINAPGAAISQYSQRVEEVGRTRANLEALRNILAPSEVTASSNPLLRETIGYVRRNLPGQGIRSQVGPSFEAAALQLPGAVITDDDIERLSAAPASERVGFLQDVIQRSPAVRNLLERIAPVETEDPGRYLFSPSRGAFGEYGSGTFGGLLYLANTVESTVGGALTDIYDAGSFLTVGRVGESSYRADVLEALTKGRDYGFTNYYDASDRPLGLLNSPVMERLRIPTAGQWAISLAGDVALGGWTDALTDGVLRGSRAGLRAARAGNSFGKGATTVAELVPDSINSVARQTPTFTTRVDEDLANRAAALLRNADPGELPTPVNGTIRLRVDGNDIEIPVIVPSRIGNPEPVQFATVAVQQAVEEGGVEVLPDATIRIWNPETLRGNNVGLIRPQYATPAMTPAQIEWAARNAPDTIDPQDISRAYRSNEELTAVAKVHGIIPSDSPVLNSRQLAALRRDHPNLLARHGRTIPVEEVNAPGRIIITRPVDEVTLSPGQGNILDLPEFTTSGGLWTPNNMPTARRMENLAKQYSDTAFQLRNTTVQEEASRLARRLSNLDRTIANNVASMDEPAIIQYRMNALPTDERPRLLDQYGAPMTRAYDSMIDEATEASTLQAQLEVVQEAARRQADVVLENVEQVRRNDIDSLATREQYGAEVPPRIEPAQTTPSADNTELNRLIGASSNDAPSLEQEALPTPTNIPDGLTQRQYELLEDYNAKRVLDTVDDATMDTVRRRMRNADTGNGVALDSPTARNMPGPGDTPVDDAARGMTGNDLLADIPRAERDIALNRMLRDGELRYENGRYSLPEEARIARTEPINTTPPYQLGIDRAIQESAWFHGTKVDAPDFQAFNYRKGASPSNELGPGLYLTTDPKLAKEYARAMPAEDIGQVGSRRMTEQGRVIEFKFNDLEGYLDGDEILDDVEVLGEVYEATSTAFRAYVSDGEAYSKLANRLKRYLKNHEPRKWAHYILAQARKEGLSNIEARNILSETFDTLSESYYGIFHLNKDGHFTMSVLDPSSLDEVRRVPVGNGSVNEGLVSRVIVDDYAHREYANAITRANVEQSQYRLTDYHRMQLTEAAKLQDVRATEAAKEYGEQQRRVKASNRQEEARRLQRLEEEAPGNAWRSNRRTDVDIDPCL